MNKLKHFDPSDVDGAMQLAYAALKLAEYVLTLNNKDVELRHRIFDVARALHLDWHESEVPETTSDKCRRVLLEVEGAKDVLEGKAREGWSKELGKRLGDLLHPCDKIYQRIRDLRDAVSGGKKDWKRNTGYWNELYGQEKGLNQALTILEECK